MSAKHTPGPWWITDSGVRDRGGYICFTPSAQRYPGQDERFAQETVERAANKALIAAAPELLEALQGAANYIDKLGGDSNSYRVLIAKADGDAVGGKSGGTA